MCPRAVCPGGCRIGRFARPALAAAQTMEHRAHWIYLRKSGVRPPGWISLAEQYSRNGFAAQGSFLRRRQGGKEVPSRLVPAGVVRSSRTSWNSEPTNPSAALHRVFHSVERRPSARRFMASLITARASSSVFASASSGKGSGATRQHLPDQGCVLP
jgi:hypothetical protein